MQITSTIAVHILLFFSLGMTGCSHGPLHPVESTAEKTQREGTLWKTVKKELEEDLVFKHDVEISRYLESLAATLAQPTLGRLSPPTQVHLIRDVEGKWQNLGLPRNELYMSVSLLKKIEFENEMAALLALEFSLVSKSHAWKTLSDPKLKELPELLGKNGALELLREGRETLRASIDLAVKILYNAGFDTRGLVRLWALYSKNQAHSPLDKKELENALEFTRQAMAQYSPLRNPVVKSQAFVAIHPRLKKL